MDLPEADPKRFPDEMCSIKVLSERVPEVLGKHYEITFPGRQWKTSRGLRNLLWLLYGNNIMPISVNFMVGSVPCISGLMVNRN